MSSIYGPSVDIGDVEDAVQNTISYWIDTYLAMKERAAGLPVPTISRPASYNETFDYLNWPEGQLPGIAIVCPGTVEEPMRRGSGDVAAWFEVSIDAIVSGQQEADTRRVAARYQGAISALLEEQSLLASGTDVPFADDLALIDWKIELPDESNRTLVVSTTTIHVLVGSILNAYDGPVTLPSPPESDADWNVAETTSLVVEGIPLDESV